MLCAGCGCPGATLLIIMIDEDSHDHSHRYLLPHVHDCLISQTTDMVVEIFRTVALRVICLYHDTQSGQCCCHRAPIQAAPASKNNDPQLRHRAAGLETTGSNPYSRKHCSCPYIRVMPPALFNIRLYHLSSSCNVNIVYGEFCPITCCHSLCSDSCE